MPVTYRQKASCLKSDVEKCQYLARLLLYGGTKLLREKFNSIHNPESLALILNDPDIKRQLEEILTDKEWQCLYPMFPFRRISSTNFDLWLILKLSRTICGLKPPVTGWYNMPHGVTFVEDLARIEHFCRTVYDEEMTDVRFNCLWRSISEVFLRIAGSICPEKRSEWEMIIDKLLQDRQGLSEVDNYVAELRSWRKRQLAEIIHSAGDALARGWVDELINPPSLGSVVTTAVTSLLNKVTQMFSAETTDDIKTPYEILARGPLALEIYRKALEQGKTIVRRIPIMLVGQEEVGKTSLKRSLKGDRFNDKEQRTRGIELDPSYCRVTTEVWRVENSNQATCSDSAISFDHHAAQMIARGLTTEKETSKTACGLKMDEERPKCKAESGESLQSTNNVELEREQSFSSRGPQTASRVSGCEPEHEKPEVPDDVANLTQKIISKDIKLDEEGVIHSVLWDFGGQSVYYVTYPLFLTSRAIYLLVYDLSRNPLDKANPVRKHGLFKELEDSFSSKTNLDYLDSWMSTVASLSSHEDEIQADHLSEKLPEKLPPVVLVCTHADQPCGGRDAAAVAAEIFGSLQGKSYSGHLVDSVFAVDNTKSGSSCECPEVLRLRNELLALAKELPQTNEQIPLKWLKFEQELLAKIKEGCKWISLEEARQVAFEVCHISTEEEFLTLVKFLHDQRIIIHFDDTPKLRKMVVLDIQWLIDVFKKVITIQPYDGKGMQHKDLWLKLEKTGILDEDLLLHVWGPMFDHMQTSESLIEIMEKFSLLCSWPSSDEKKQYLVPSMLMSHPSEDIIRLVKSSQLPSLYLTFNFSQVPIGFFPRMVLQFYQWCSKEWPSPCKPQFYQNFARFHICPDEGCSVILLCHSSFIEMVVHRASDEVRDLSERLQTMATRSCPNLNSQKPDVIVARVVRRQVGLILECMPKEFVWLKNMKCEMKVLCSVCCSGGSVEYCKDHRIKHCKREECLHFWSEAELQSVQQFCDRSAVAGDPRLSLEQFVPWLTFLDEEQVIDGCAARDLLSAEEKEAQALALSTGVVESLQSASDPCSVVAHLQESLQLNQGALADPTPETTQLIRSLAVIAKSENRLDVVQHLRQITPAGTTGPLLPDCLDVQKIPPPQIKELTFNLCGGDEWKLLADKLGLTPWEIRYLNNRTINPCLEALVHIRKQRFINVDALYNALVECGLPVLADIL